MKYPLKLIEWEDAFNGNHNWMTITESEQFDEDIMLVQTVGFVVQDSPERIKVAMSVAEHPDGVTSICDLFTIPRACIRREKTLRARMAPPQSGETIPPPE